MNAYESSFWPDPAADARPAVLRTAFARFALDGPADLAAWDTELRLAGSAL